VLRSLRALGCSAYLSYMVLEGRQISFLCGVLCRPGQRLLDAGVVRFSNRPELTLRNKGSFPFLRRTPEDVLGTA